ncbi:cytochrome P450 [Kitasatospora sp. MAP12-15]|uniref:cytochrome P450 n=1 Tax=unclassified Kitasatospora TaxID=2633591 RepID=UPI002474D208|nr:cytochrome P450 [Kitasatospora sp. MAP12-44]MDH6108796.1 cytochrome P450 [Kitasatospora sp. MAP12-44]
MRTPPRCPFPFPQGPGIGAPTAHEQLARTPGLTPVTLPSGLPAQLVARWAEVRTVLSDDRFSRASFPGHPLFARSSESLALAASDPPLHTRRRQAVRALFTARAARRLEPELRRLAEQALDRLVTLPQPTDLVEEFTVPFALRAITGLLGVPPEDEPWLRPRVDRMMSTTRFTAPQVATAHQEAREYFSELVERREREIAAGTPGADMLTALLSAPEERRLSRAEVVVFGAGLLMAGYETTSNQLAMCALVLFGEQGPGLADRLRAQPGALPAALEELLRLSSLVATGGAPHVVTEDLVLGSTPLRAGEVVVPLTDAANLDAERFAQPTAFDPDRADNPHLAFGHGRHYCLGADLARAELRIGLSALLERFDGLRVDAPARGPRWRQGMFIRGPEQLPVRWSGLRARG